MGQSDEANRFRLILDSELRKAGFDTVENASAADAELTGALTVRVYSDTSRARVAVILKTIDGESIWERDFEPPAFGFGLGIGRTNDTVKLRAQDVAKALRKEVANAGKNSTKWKSTK